MIDGEDVALSVLDSFYRGVEAGRFPRLEYLDECRWDLRGWEHRQLWSRFNAKQTLLGHTDKVTSVAFSPDSKRILTGSEDHTAKVWDAEQGQEILSLNGHTRGVTSVAFSPDGKRILTGSSDKTEERFRRLVAVWLAETGHISSSSDLVAHPAFLEIIGMGPAVIPLLLGELEKHTGHWHRALRRITGADPGPCGHAVSGRPASTPCHGTCLPWSPCHLVLIRPILILAPSPGRGDRQ